MLNGLQKFTQTTKVTNVGKGTQPNHKVTDGDNLVQPIPKSVTDKIIADSKKKAKQQTDKNKAPSNNWIARL